MKSAASPRAYWSTTRHPWSCVLFVFPLLALYEFGLIWLGPAPDSVRNGADLWLRSAVRAAGFPAYAAPCILVAILFVWCIWRRQDRPGDLAGTWAGMAAESALFALALFGCSQVLGHAAAALERHLDWGSAARLPEPALEQMVRYVGAGIYEETLFRLLLFSALLALCTLAEFPPGPGTAVAALGSALLFATAHHLGPAGDAWNGYVFTFRTLAGVYFAWLFQVRGFGIAVGAHAGYDVLVGLLTPLAR
jgi:hypothetical protein